MATPERAGAEPDAADGNVRRDYRLSYGAKVRHAGAMSRYIARHFFPKPAERRAEMAAISATFANCGRLAR